jgi:sulfite exporter TauE/SafE
VSPDYGLAFATGLLGAFGHCLGMCGPIVAAFALGGKGDLAWTAHLLYNAGRVVTYTFIGALMGLAGSFVNTAGALAGAQNAVALVAGTVMVVMGLGIAGALPYARRVEKSGSPLLKAAAPILESSSALRFFPLGLLLGFLPCGLSYTIFVGAAATGDMLRGFLFTLSFGMATIPALLLFGLLMNFVSARVRGVIYRLGGVAIVISGLIFIRRGLLSYAAM